LEAIIAGRSPTEIAALHRTSTKRAEIEKCASVQLSDYLKVYLHVVLDDVQRLTDNIKSGEASILVKTDRRELP
jgi:hypothetical protein